MKTFLTLVLLSISIFSFSQTSLTVATDFTVTDVAGNNHNLFNYLNSGKHVIIQFFTLASCPNCTAQAPIFNDAYIAFGCNESDVIFLSIDGGDTTLALTTFRDANSLRQPIISGVNGGGDDVILAYDLVGAPTTILIAPDLSIINQNINGGVYNNIVTALETAGCVQHPCEGQAVPDFEANETTVMVGTIVEFTDLSTNSPDSWRWTCSGGIPAFVTDQNPRVTYNTLGVYPVSLEVSNPNFPTLTLTKDSFIHVVPPATIYPYANFVANYTIVLVGSTVNFTDLSQFNVFSRDWEFEGGTPATSRDVNPNITYNTRGLFSVKYFVSNNIGNDSMVKLQYIHVVSFDDITSKPDADFRASSRLVNVNEQIAFEDLSDDLPLQWNWSFPGANNISSTVQNPRNISYSTTGQKSVTLRASNNLGFSVLEKTQYIYVAQANQTSYCDTLTNIGSDELTEYVKLQYVWGYFPGHNGRIINEYADKYTNYAFSEITGFYVDVIRSYPGFSNSTVKFKVWNGIDEPDSVIFSKYVNLSSMTDNYKQPIFFNDPVPINGHFFCGFELNYNNPDTFVVTMARDRGNNNENTLMVKRNGEWESSLVMFPEYRTSLGIYPFVCLTGVDEISTDTPNTILVYPNPSQNIVNVSIEKVIKNNVIQITAFDMLGKKIVINQTIVNSNQYQLDFSEQKNGIYFITIVQGKVVTTKKIIISK